MNDSSRSEIIAKGTGARTAEATQSGKEQTAKTKRSYHHGNLRAALLQSAEQELIEKGVDKFSLRGVAKRAGVSHAAPAHHFGDVDGLLTALTAISFDRFHAHMRQWSDKAGDDPHARLVAIGLAYIDYAKNNPAMFDMQFTSSRVDHCTPEMAQASPLAYLCLQEHMNAVLKARHKNPDMYPDAANAYWALAHGLATLFARGRNDPRGDLLSPDYTGRFKQILSDYVQTF